MNHHRPSSRSAQSRTLRRGCYAALGLAVALGAPVSAQQAQPAEFSSWRTPGWSFTPGGTFSGAFDSNVALASVVGDTRRAHGDQVLIVAPTGQLEFVANRTEFASGYRGSLRRYRDIDQLNGFDQRGYLSLRRLATKRLTYSLEDSYAAVPTTDEVELNGVPFSRTGSRTNTFGGGIEARLTKFTDLTARYDLIWVDFDQTDTLLTGGWVTGVRTALSHRLNERLAGGGEYGIRLADLNDGTRELTFQDAGGTVRYLLSARTRLSLAGGVSYLRDKSFDQTRTGPYVRAGLTHDTEHATVGASFERTFVPSFGFGGSSQSQEVRTFLRMPLNKNRMYVQGSAAWRRSDPFVTTEFPLDTVWLRSALGYWVARWLRAETFYAFTRQDSRVAGGQINRHRAGVQVVVSQPMRIR